jgi:hypothetical protein
MDAGGGEFDVDTQGVAGVGDGDVADVEVLPGNQILDDGLALRRRGEQNKGEGEKS